jgi:hypothetical protein
MSFFKNLVQGVIGAGVGYVTGGPAGAVAGGVSGYMASANKDAGDKNQASAINSLSATANALAKITPPNLEDYITPFQQAVWLGQLTPEEYVATIQKDSEMKGIKIDPNLLQAQKEALSKLHEIATAGGLTAADRAQLNDIALEESAKARGARDAATNEFASRGMSGSGMEVLRRDTADQSAVSAASKRGTDVAALAQQRALQALMSSGQLAGSMRAQDFSEQSSTAQAQDAINRFNASATQSAAAANTAARNQAAADALNQRYNVQQANINQSNAENAARVAAAQQGFTNNVALATGGQASNVALGKMLGDQAASDKTAAGAAYNKLGQLIGTPSPTGPSSSGPSGWDSLAGKAVDYFKGGSAATNTADAESQAGGFYSDRGLKKDVTHLTPEDITSILDELTGYKYRYKDPKHGAGDTMGVMAQDLLNTKAKDMVNQGDDGLQVDRDKATSFALAALAGINDRLKKVEGK